MRDVKIIIDNRERNLEVIQGLESAGVEIEISSVPVGDYILSDRVCVERKTMADFENSIMNSRLFEQLSRLKSSFPKPILLLENGSEPRLSRNVVLGAMLKAYIDYGVQVIESSGPDETVAILYGIAKREQEGDKHEPRLVGIKKAYAESQWQQLILESMPGIGPKIAKALLNRFGNIKGVINASENELTSVDKIGKKKAARLYSIFNRNYNSSDKNELHR